MSLKKKVPLSSGGGGGGFLAKTKESSSEIKEEVGVGEIAKNRLHVSRKSDGRATKMDSHENGLGVAPRPINANPRLKVNRSFHLVFVSCLKRKYHGVFDLLLKMVK